MICLVGEAGGGLGWRERGGGAGGARVDGDSGEGGSR